MGKKRNNPKRVSKYSNSMETHEETIVRASGAADPHRVVHVAWDKTTVELWAWINEGRLERLELHGLEEFPSREQLEPALALYHDLRQKYRREHGTYGRPISSDVYDYFLKLGECSHSELRTQYEQARPKDDNAVERFNRTVRRYKQTAKSRRQTK